MARGLPFDYPVLNLGRRPLRTLLLGAAAALVAGVLLGASGFARGLDQGFRTLGDPNVALFLSRGSDRDLLRSTLSPSVAELAAARVPDLLEVGGVQAVSPEIHMATRMALLAPGQDAPVGEERFPAFTRGVTERAFLVHDRVQLETGQAPGPSEVLVGRLVARSLGLDDEALAPGQRLYLEGGVFTVSGIFAAPGTTLESEIWVPFRTLQARSQRDDVSTIFFRFNDPEAFADLSLFAARRLDLELEAVPSVEHYAAMAAWFAPIQRMAMGMALLLGLAAIFTGANTVGSMVRDRQGELAAILALGFTPGALLRALLVETLLLTLAGGVLGLLVMLPLVTGRAFRIGMGAFALAPGLEGILVALGGVVLLAVVGIVPAAWRIFRLPVARALAEGRG